MTTPDHEDLRERIRALRDRLDGEGFSFTHHGHIYRSEGIRLPSVTEIISFHGLGANFSGIPPEIIARAGRWGTDVHRAMAFAIEEDLDRDSLDPMMIRDIDAGMGALEMAGLDPIALEMPLMSPTYRYAGTIDLIGFLYESRKLAIIDYKTGAPPHDWVDLQLSMYAHLLRENLALSGWALSSEDLELICMPIRDGRAKMIPQDPLPSRPLMALVDAWHLVQERGGRQND